MGCGLETIPLPRYAQVGALPSYNGSDIEAIEVCVPIKEEQTKIAELFVKLGQPYHPSSA